MNPQRQYELMTEARKHLDQGYALMREALREGPVRLNREESLDIWRATTRYVEDILPALEVFIANDLQALMDPGQTTLTRKQIWRLFYLKRDHDVRSASDILILEDQEQLNQEELRAQHLAWAEEDARWRAAERKAKDVWMKAVSPIYKAFGLYLPGRKCTGRTKDDRPCNGSAQRLSDVGLCVQHSSMAAELKLKLAEWELYFGMTVAEFDHEVRTMFSEYATVKRLANVYFQED